MKNIKRQKEDIIITPDYIRKNRWKAVKLLENRRRGSILDVLELEGSYALENAFDVFNSIAVGEELAVTTEEVPKSDMLTVKTKGGLTVGFLPASTSLLLRFLHEKQRKIKCFLEYKDYTGGVLTVIVSLYTDSL